MDNHKIMPDIRKFFGDFLSRKLPVEGVVSEIQKLSDLFGLNVTLFAYNSCNAVEIGKAVVNNVSGSHSLDTLVHTVGEDGNDTENIGTCLTENVNDLENASAGRDKILNDNYLLTLLQLTLDLVLSAVILSTAQRLLRLPDSFWL